MARCSALVWSSGLPARTPSWAASRPSADIGAAAGANDGATVAATPARSVRRSMGMAALRERHHSAVARSRADFTRSRLTPGERGEDRLADAEELREGEAGA